MKNFKRKISFVVAVAVLVSVLSTGFYVGSAEAVSLLSAEEEGLLRYLEVITEENVDPDYGARVTRGELAHIAARVMNATPSANEGSYFYDVTETNAYYEDVNALVDAGVIHGDGNGNYRPLDAVTELEIAKVFSVILGYGEIGEYESYQSIARHAGVFDGTEQDGIVTYAEALRIAYNTLHCGMFEAIIYGDDTTYQARKDYLAIQNYHNLVYQTGLVEAVWGTGLRASDDSMEKGEILIGGRRFVWNDESVLGKHVIFYSPYDHTIQRPGLNIAYLYVDKVKTNVLEVKAEDIKGLSGYDFSYYVDGSEKVAKMTRFFDVIYNGVAYPEYKSDQETKYLKPNFGSVTLIDNDADKSYDIAVINEFKYLQVHMLDTDNNKVFAKYPKDLIVGSENHMVTTVISGEENQMNRILLGSMVAYKESKNKEGAKKLYLEQLSDESITGVFEGSDSKSITVGGTRYEIPNANALVVDRAYAMGETVTIYTHLGRCVAVFHDAGTSNFTYIYMLQMANTGGTFVPKVTLRCATRMGEEVYLECADKVRIDGTSLGNWPVDDYSMLDRYMRANAARTNQSGERYGNDPAYIFNQEFSQSQLIRYRTNSEGKVIEIDTINYNPQLEDATSLQLEENKYQVNHSVSTSGTFVGGGYYHSNQGNVYRHIDGSIGGLNGAPAHVFSVAEPTDIWKIPCNRDEFAYYGDVTQGDWVGFRAAEGYTVDSDSGLATIAIFYVSRRDEDALPKWANNALVSDVWTEMNADGEVVTAFTTADEGATVRVSETALYSIPEVKVGDIVKYRANSQNEVVSLAHVYDIQTDVIDRTYAQMGDMLAEIERSRNYFTAKGVVMDWKDDRLKLYRGNYTKLNDIENDLVNIEYFKVPSTTPVFIYDSADGTVTAGKMTDLVTRKMDANTTQKVIVAQAWQNVKYIYIMK